jgi:hypothetical protein
MVCFFFGQEKEELMREKPYCGYVFHDRGRRIVNYYKRWHWACQAAGLLSEIVHDFGRMAVHSVVRTEIPERVVMKGQVSNPFRLGFAPSHPTLVLPAVKSILKIAKKNWLCVRKTGKDKRQNVCRSFALLQVCTGAACVTLSTGPPLSVERC